MFIYNLKFNKKNVSRLFLIVSFIIIIAIIAFSIYLIFFNHSSSCEKSNHIIEINENNYTNVLKASNENIDSYIGTKVHVTGYVYRLLDFSDSQFVVARDMRFGENTQSLVVGFLCDYKKATNFSDGTWVDIEGEIVKGNFNGDIAMLKVLSIKEASRPQNLFVNPPDGNYIPVCQ